MEIKIDAKSSYERALQKAFETYLVNEADKPEFERIFKIGWEASKKNLFEILDLMSEETNGRQ